MIYKVFLTCEMSQVIDVEADDVDAAIEQAMDDHDLFPNVSNKFDGGDPEAYSVEDADGKVIWSRGKAVE